jgi:hypothetical protein
MAKELRVVLFPSVIDLLIKGSNTDKKGYDRVPWSLIFLRKSSFCIKAVVRRESGFSGLSAPSHSHPRSNIVNVLVNFMLLVIKYQMQ